MAEQLFPASQVSGRKGTKLRKEGKRKRPGKGDGLSGTDTAARPAVRRQPREEKGKHKSRAASGGRQALRLPPRIENPREAASRVPDLPHQQPACPE